MIVETTVPSVTGQRAHKIARAAVEARVAACANVHVGMVSHYWWKGKLARASESLIVFKTTARALPRLIRLIESVHPDKVPYIGVVGIHFVRNYGNWIAEVVGSASPRRNGR